jgi:HD-GYP domain-containing protein (c-di-GMP phosphodiesterase class II)
MAKKHISIDQLVPGMHIVGLDIPWMKTPFLVHKMTVKNQEQVAKLRQSGVKVATIDTDKGIDVAVAEAAPTNAPSRREQLKPSSLNSEMQQAGRVRSVTRTTMQKALSLIQQDEPIKQSMITPLIDGAVDSLLRNSEALLILAHQRSKGMHLINHSFNCMSLAMLLAQQIGLPEQRIEWVGQAALLMDIGWIKIAAEYFTLGYPYTDEEYHAIQQHVGHSVEILDQGGFAPEVIGWINDHHERMDGEGYPAQLSGEEIPLESRILSLVDHFDSGVNGYYDSPADLPPEVLRDIYGKAKKGCHDTQVAESFVQMVGIYPISSGVLLNTGERAVVTRVNSGNPLKPRIKICYSKQLTALTQPIDLDLGKQQAEPRSVKRVIDPASRSEDPLGLLSIE